MTLADSMMSLVKRGLQPRRDVALAQIQVQLVHSGRGRLAAGGKPGVMRSMVWKPGSVGIIARRVPGMYLRDKNGVS
jgi:hypothetical protein